MSWILPPLKTAWPDKTTVRPRDIALSYREPDRRQADILATPEIWAALAWRCGPDSF